MNAKNRMINRLLRVAKKHKMFTYPVLAIVAIISAVSYFFSWTTGAGKRIVAVVMVMVMLVSQSYFLTSSATALVDDAEAVNTQNALQKQDNENGSLVTTEASGKTTEKSTRSEQENATTENTTLSSESTDETVTTDATTETGTQTENGNDEPAGDNTEPEENTTETAGENGLHNGAMYSTNIALQNGANPVAASNSKKTVNVYVRLESNLVFQGEVKSNEDESSTLSASEYTYNLANTVIYDTTYAYDAFLKKAVDDAEKSFSENGCYTVVNALYTDKNCTNALDATTFASMHVNSEYGIYIYVKRELTRYKINVSASYDEQTISFRPGTGAYESESTYYTDIDPDTKKATFTLENVACSGYKLTGATVTGGSATVGADGTSLNVTLDAGTDTTRTITPTWEGEKFNVTYMKKTKGSSDNEAVQWQEIVYGDNNTQTLLAEKDVAGLEKKPGYEFKCWEFEDGRQINVDASTYTYRELLYNKGTPAKLYPVYEFVDFEIADAPEKNTINFQYKMYHEQILLKAQYKKSEDAGVKAGAFTFEIVSGKTELAAMGITAELTADSSGVSIETESNGPTGVTSATIPLVMKVTDSNGEEREFTIDINVQPKKLKMTLNKDEQKTKTYDGTTKVPDEFPDKIPTMDENGKTTTVTVSITSGEPQYNSANVAEANKITIPSDYSFNVEAGDNANNYTLEHYDIEGCKIEQRRVYLKTTTSRKQVRTGEKTPVNSFGVEDDVTSNKPADYGFCGSDGIEQLGEIEYTTRPERLDLLATGTYTVIASTTSSSNYKAHYDLDAQASFEVIQEKPILNTNYEIQATTGENGWYSGEGKIAAIKGAGYDTVIIIDEDGTEIKDGILREEYSGNPYLKIKLYDSSTGAVTSTESIDIKYDSTKPVYVGYTVDELQYESGEPPISETGKPLYFPNKGGAFDFGTYVRSSVTIRVKYESDTSGLLRLEFGLFGEEVGTRQVNFDTTTGIATISTLKEMIEDADSKVGVIRCRAVDRAGNVSDTVILKPTKDSSDSYEWSVEKASPSIEPLTVYSGEKQNVIVIDQTGVADKDMAYYNHCKAILRVTDEVSGINSVSWYVNGVETQEEVGDGKKKVTSGVFEKSIPADNTDKPYTIYAVVRDNAGNEMETNQITCKLDDIAPELEVTYNENVWSKDTTIRFTTSDSLSGVYYARVTDADGNTIDCDLGSPVDGVYSATFQAVKKGQYTVEVSDKAGNITRWTKNIDKISTEVPQCPTVSFLPEEPDGKDGWYVSKPTAVLHTVLNTTDETPVESEYSMWKDEETSYNKEPISGTEDHVLIEDEGIFHIKVWSKSASGVYCADCDNNISDIKVDTSAPTISFTTEKGSGTNIIVKFTITDMVSGVDKDSVKILHGKQKLTATLEEIENGYSGSFEIKETGNYSIQAADLAGNVSDEAAFTPMSMKIKAITNITESTALLGASVFKGTYDIVSATMEYRKLTDATYTETETVVNRDENGNVALSANVSGLEDATYYAYKVTAVSEAGEVLEYEGYFKTLTTDSTGGITVTGTARYSTNQSGTITVGMYLGNSCIMAQDISAGSEFVFEHVADGNYNIVATDGTYARNVRVSIQDGMIEYPTEYIDIVLSGKNTSVYLTTQDTPNITADNMDSIFADDIINFTDDDKALIDAGGTVEFQLCATLMTVSNVSAGEIAAMYAVTDKNKIVGAYLDLTLYKIVTATDGSRQKKKVTNLANGANISVTIPLGELAGKPGLEVIRIHNDGENFIGSSLADQDSNVNTYTITTNQFSTYAVLYGTNVEPTTETTMQTGGEQIGTSENGSTVTSEKPWKNTTSVSQKDKDKEDKSQSSSIGSLRSSGTAKTGDATPITLLFCFTLIAMGGIWILRKQLKQ